MTTKLNKTLLICFSFLINANSIADDVTDSVKEGLDYYKQGNLNEAASSLEYAAQLIKQKRSSSLEDYLPQALKGWQAEQAKTQATGAAMMGGMVSASKRYNKDRSEVKIEIITDSPMLQGMMMMFSNPMFATSDGGKLTKIKGQKAIVKYDASSKDGEINLVIANRILVKVEGDGVEQKDLMDYASAIDYKKLAGF